MISESLMTKNSLKIACFTLWYILDQIFKKFRFNNDNTVSDKFASWFQLARTALLGCEATKENKVWPWATHLLPKTWLRSSLRISPLNHCRYICILISLWKRLGSVDFVHTLRKLYQLFSTLIKFKINRYGQTEVFALDYSFLLA